MPRPQSKGSHRSIVFQVAAESVELLRHAVALKVLTAYKAQDSLLDEAKRAGERSREKMGPPFCKGHSRRQLGRAPEEAEEPLDDNPGAPRRAEPEQRRETKATQSPRQGVDPLEKESHPRIYTVDGFQARQGATKLKRSETDSAAKTWREPRC